MISGLINNFQISALSEEQTLYLEISTFLKELSCSYRNLTEGSIADRFRNPDNKLDLLEYLITELQAAKITAVRQPIAAKATSTTHKSVFCLFH
jgi:hypothetical protein